MALLYNEITKNVYFKDKNGIFECLESSFSKKNRQKGTNTVKIKNLETGGVTTKTLHSSDSFEPVEIEKESIVFIYTKGNISVFHKIGAPGERFEFGNEKITGLKFLKDKEEVVCMKSDDRILKIQTPTKVELKVKNAPPNIKGSTVTGGSKRVILENGTVISVPMFINEGDVIKINTQKEEYVERVS